VAKDRAGVIVTRDGTLLMTLAKERKWRRTPDGVTHIPIRWVGGKLQTGESFAAAAVREAEEEIAAGVTLHHADLTYVGARGSSAAVLGPPGPRPAPLLVTFRGDARSVSYRATLDGDPKVGDVPAILWVPFDALPALAHGVPFARFGELGIDLRSDVELPADARAFLGSTGTEHLTGEVIDRYGSAVLASTQPDVSEPAIQLS